MGLVGSPAAPGPSSPHAHQAGTAPRRIENHRLQAIFPPRPRLSLRSQQGILLLGSDLVPLAPPLSLANSAI